MKQSIKKVKEEKMKKKIKKTSYYGRGKTNYLNKEGTYYTYKFIELNDAGKYVPAVTEIEVTDKTIEYIAVMDKYDHDEDVQLRNARDNIDWDFYNKEVRNSEKSGFVGQQSDLIPDSRGDVYSQIFTPPYRNLKAEAEVKKLKENVTELQLFLLNEHGILGKTMKQICEEMQKEGKKTTVKALESCWRKIRNKASKLLNRELPRRGKR